MDSVAYKTNQNKQKKSLKKYRKHILKALLWGGIGLASALFFPAGVFPALKGVLGESIAMNATFLTQWGIAAAGGIGAVVNTIKANRERKKIEVSQDEEEDIVDAMITENDNLSRKVEGLEKQKVKEEKKSNTLGNNLTKSNSSIDYEEEEEKKHTR